MSEREREIELIDYIEVLLARKWLIALATLVCMAGAAWQSKSAPIQYQASALLFVAAPQQDMSEVGSASLGMSFYTAVALSDEIRLAIDSYRNRLIESGAAAAGGGFSLSATAVDQSSIRLTVTSGVPELTVPLLTAWKDTLIVKTNGITASESMEFYQFVTAQLDSAVAKLEESDEELESFERDQKLSALERRKAAFETQIVALQERVFEAQFGLREREAELARARAVVAVLEVDGVPLHLLDRSGVAALEIGSLDPLARDMIDNLASRKAAKAMQSELLRQRQVSLAELDRATGYAVLAARAERLTELRDDFAGRVGGAEGDIATGKLLVESIGSELDDLDAVQLVAKAMADEELWRSADGEMLSPSRSAELDRFKLYSEIPNPVYSTLEQLRANASVELEHARQLHLRGPHILDSLEVLVMTTQLRLYDAERDRAQLLSAFEVRDRAVNDQVRVLERVHRSDTRNYIENKEMVGDLAPQIAALRGALADDKALLESFSQEASGAMGQANKLLARRGRITRTKEVVSASLERFSGLLEEARIARQRAGSNLRLITLDKTWRSITPPPRSRSILIGGGVGLLVSVFMAFLLEYVRRARATRDEALAADAASG